MTARIYIAKLNGLDDIHTFEEARSEVSTERQNKIDRIVHNEDRIRSAGAYLLLRRMLADRGVDYSDTRELRLTKGDSGKPFLQDYPELFFNLSHSGDRVMGIMCDHECGCDVQLAKGYNAKVARRFFHTSEYERIESVGDIGKQEELFNRYWTCKESYIKATGRGMSEGLDSVVMELPVVPGEAFVIKDGEYTLREFNIPQESGEYNYAACVQGCCEDFRLITVDIIDIISAIKY